MALFAHSNRKADAWFLAGSASSFPNLTSSEVVSVPQSCKGVFVPGCKIFQVPRDDPSSATEVKSSAVEEAFFSAEELKDQVLIFQYRGKFHAMDNQCPHSSFPLSNGSPFEIEDFGIVLSAGIICPKHSWSFDLFTGRSDRANYKLKLWEVQLRATVGDDHEVWVRKKQRIG